MTDPDLTALAVDAARIVGWEWRKDYLLGGDHMLLGWWRGGEWLADLDADLLDDADTDNPALLFAALLDWCHEQGLGPSVRDHKRGGWLANVLRVDTMTLAGGHHATKLGAVLLALHRAGVVG